MANWWDQYDAAPAPAPAPTPPPTAPGGATVAAGAPWWATLEQGAAQRDNDLAGSMAAGDWGWASRAPSAGSLPPGATQVGAIDDVPRLDANGKPAPIPTDQDVQALQRGNAAIAYADRGAIDSPLVGPSRIGQALAAAPAQAFDARFGKGTAASYGAMDLDPATQPAGPAFLSGDWWKQQLGGGGDGASYGEGAGYLIDNPLTRGLGQGVAAVNAGVGELLGRGISAISPGAGQWWQQYVMAPAVARTRDLEPAGDAGIGALTTQALGNLGSQLSLGSLSGGVGEAATATGTGLMGAARAALTSPQLRTAAFLGASQAGNEAAQLEAEGKPVSADDLISMASTATAANLVPMAGRWSLPARVASGAAVGEATNEANNVVTGRPLGTGAAMAVGLGAALGVLPGHHTASLADEGRSLADQIAFGQRMDFLRDGVARQDLEERLGQVAQQTGGAVPETVAQQLAAAVAQEHGTSVDALLRAPRGPAEAGAAAADQILADAHQAVAASAPPLAAADAPAIAPNALRDVAPREPTLPPAPTGATRDDLVQAWRNAGTDAERATAAADIAAFDALIGRRDAAPVDAKAAEPEAVTPPAEEPTAPAAPPVAALSLPEAGDIIDRRLAALDEIAARAKPAEELRSLGQDAGDLEDLLRGEYAKRQSGVVRSASNSLSDAELADAEQRLAAARSALEDHRQAVAAGNQARQLRDRLSKIDSDEDLRQFAGRLAGVDERSRAPVAAREPVSAPDVGTPWWKSLEQAPVAESPVSRGDALASRDVPPSPADEPITPLHVEPAAEASDQQFHAANQWFRDNLQGTQVSAPDGTPVVFSSSGRTKSLSTGRRDPRRMGIIRQLPELAARAPVIEEAADRAQRDGVAYAYAAVPVEIEGKTYGVKMIYRVGQEGGRRFYDFRGFDMEDPGAADRGLAGGPDAQGSPGSEPTIAQLREAFKKRPAFSADLEATGGSASRDQVRQAATRAWGSRFIGKLEREGVLHVIDTDEAVSRGLAASADELRGVKGLYHDGRAYIVADQVRDLSDVPGIVLHEAGLHYGYDRLTTEADRLALRRMVNRAIASGDEDMVKAWQHAERVGTPARALHEEAMAYLAEHAPGHGIVTRVIDALKRGLNRVGIPVSLLESDSEAIRRTARDMLRAAASGERPARARVEPDGVQDWRASTIGGAPVFSRAYHGTPYRGIEKEGFRLNKIGSGEGAQAFGHGIYFASNRKVAEGYRETLSKQHETSEWVLQESGAKDPKTAAQWIDEYLRDAENGMHPFDITASERNNLLHAKAAFDAGQMPSDGGQLYHAEVPDEHEMLDWDKPLHRQPESVRRGISRLLDEAISDRGIVDRLRHAGLDNRFGDRNSVSGEEFYRAIEQASRDGHIVGAGETPGLAEAIAEGQHDRAASLLLSDYGIPGLQYLDGLSRRHGDGSRNYVVWDESRLNQDVTPYYSRYEDADTPAFRRFFEGSRVVDEEGRPRRVYHGTASDHTVFRDDVSGHATGHATAPLGHFFTERRAQAEHYARNASDGVPAEERVVDAHLAIRRPAEFTLEQLQAIDSPDEARQVRRRLEAEGYDGIHVKDAGQWIAFDSRQIKSATDNRGTYDPTNPDIRYSRTPAAQVRQQAAAARTSILSHLAAQGYGQGAIGWSGNPAEYEGWRAGVQKAIAGLFDKMDPVRRAEGAIRERTGQDIPDDADVYRLENLMHGRAADRLDALDRTSVKPLLKAMKGAGVSPKLLMDYLYARHAPERNARIATINKDMPDGGSGLTTQEARDILAGNAPGPYSGQTISAADLPKLQALAARVDRVRDQTIATLEGSGQITPQLAAQLRKQWQHYVPLRGKEGEAETPKGAGRGVNIKGKPVKRALGRGAGNVAPPNILAEIVGDAQRAIIQAEKARVGRAVLKLAAEYPNPDLWQVEPVDLEWRFSESTGEAYLAPKRPTNDQDVLTVMHDGKPYMVRLKDPRIRDAVLNLGAEKAQWLVNTLGRFNRWLSAVSTRFNPAFTPINALRDMTLGMTGLTAEHGAATAADAAAHYLPALRASWRDAAHAPGDASVPDAQKSMDDWAREFAERGGKTGLVHFNDVESTSRALEDKFRSGMELLGELRPLAAAGKALETLQPIAHVVELANEATENALRLASYVALRKRGMSADRAAAYAKDLTVNFNRKGQWAGVLNTLYLFYNASAQGVRRSLQLMRNPKVLGFLGSIAALQGSQTALLMSRKGEDGVSDWDAIPDWKKERSLIIALPGQGHYFALPMPYEFGFMVFAGGRLTQAALNREPSTKGNLVNDLGAGMLQAFSPIPLDNGPTGLAPELFKIPLHLAENRDDFGRRITADQPYAPYDMPRTAMGKTGTAAPYVWLARALNRAGGGDPDYRPPEIARGLLDWSPEDLQYLSNTMLGGLGSFASGTWTSAEKMLAGNYKAKKDGSVTVDWPALMRDLPIVKSFGWETDSNRARSDRFYDIRDQIERVKAMVQDRLDEGDIRGAQRVAKEAGVFADGMAVKTNQDGSPAMRLKHTSRGDVRTYQVGAVPGSLYAAYREVTSGLSQRNEDTGLSEKVQAGVADYNRQIQRAYQLPVAERTRVLKELQDQRGGLMGAFLRVYEQRKQSVPTPGT